MACSSQGRDRRTLTTYYLCNAREADRSRLPTRTWFENIGEMHAALDNYLVAYNRKRPHQGRRMDGRTPW